MSHAPSPPAGVSTGRRPSLLEILVWAVALVTGLATGWVVHQRRTTPTMEHMAQARDMVHALRAALQQPRPHDSTLPSTAQGLAALVADGTIDRVPTDPWGRPYVYRFPGQEAAYELFSLGPDGIESQDDIVSWNLYGGRAVRPASPATPPTPTAHTP